jgi:malate permease and related proteins
LFPTLATVATLFARRAAAKDARPAAMLRKVLGFPPLVALAVALLTHPLPWPEWVDVVLGRLGDMLTPLALFSVGYQLRLSGVKGRVGPLALGLGYKLVLAPLAIALMMRAVPGVSRLTFEVTVLEAAMAPMITAAILAADHDLDPQLSALMVGLGIPLSFATVPLSLWLMR